MEDNKMEEKLLDPLSDIILSNDEQKAVDKFLSFSNVDDTKENRQLIIRCLVSRGMNISSSIELFTAHYDFLRQENLLYIDPINDDQLRADILSGKFTILNDDEFTGARVAQFFCRLHRPSTTSHSTVLKNILFQLRSTLMKEVAVRDGLIVIFDMTRAKYANFDMDLSMKFFTMLKYKYPMKLRSLIVLSNSLWARTSLKVLRVFLSENFKDVHVVEPKEGTELANLANAPEVDHINLHYKWIVKCLVRLKYIEAKDDKNINQFFRSSKNGIRGAYNDSTNSLNTCQSFHTNTLPNGKKLYKKSQKNGSFSESSMSINKSPARHLVYNFGRRVQNTTANVVRKCSFTSSLIHPSSKRSSSLLGKGPSTMSAGSLAMSDDLQDNNNNPNQHGEPHDPGMNGDEEDDKTLLHQENLDDGLFEDGRKSGLFTGSLRVSPTKTKGIFHIPDGSAEICSLGRAEVRVCRANRKSRVIPVIDGSIDMNDYPSTADKITQELADASSVLTNEFNLEIKNAPLAAQETDGDRIPFEQKPPLSSSGDKHMGKEKTRFKTNKTSRNSSINIGNKENKNTTNFGTSNGKSLRDKYSPLSWALKGNLEKKSSSHTAEIEERIVNNCDYCLALAKAKKTPKRSMEEPPLDSCFSCEEEMICDQISGPPSLSNPPVWSTHRPEGTSVHLHSHLDSDASVNLLHHVSPYNPACDLDYLPASPEALTKENILSNPILFPLHGSSLDDPDFDDSEDEIYRENGETFRHRRAMNLIDTKRLLLNSWLNPQEFLKHIAINGLNGIINEYNTICNIQTVDSMYNFKNPMNRPKNRYNDVVCYEHNRVLIRCKRDPLLMITELDNPSVTTNPQTNGATTASSTNSLSNAANNTSNTSQTTDSNRGDDKYNSTQNYIHANWVDSYRQKNAFICTQGPLLDTAGDFWRLVWDYNVPVIVMITKTIESSRFKCHQYWPKSGSVSFHDRDFCQNSHSKYQNPFDCDDNSSEEDDSLIKSTQKEGIFKVIKVHCVNTENFSKSLLRISYSSTGEERNVHHYAFNAWPDHGVPRDTSYLLELLSSVNATYQDHLRRHHGYTCIYDQDIPPPPIVVHCSAGIGRTGTFISLDVCTKALYHALQMKKEKDPKLEIKLNIPLTVSRIRSQRAGCVQVSAQYVFCYRALLSYMHQLEVITTSEFETANSYLTNDENNQSSLNYPYSSYQMKDLFKMKNQISFITSSKNSQPIPIPPLTTNPHNNNIDFESIPMTSTNESLKGTSEKARETSESRIIYPKNLDANGTPFQNDVQSNLQKMKDLLSNNPEPNDNDLSDYENDSRKLSQPLKGPVVFSSSSPSTTSDSPTKLDSSQKKLNGHLPPQASHNQIHNPLSLSEYETEDENYPDDMNGTIEPILS